MENEKIPLPRYYASDLVKEALKNAEMVLNYGTETGLEINSADIEVITESKILLNEDNWNKEIEIKFWVSYKNLTALIKPVSVDCLKASQETFIKKQNFFQRLFRIKVKETLAYRTVRIYTVSAVLTMAVMLLLHIYFSIGTVRLNRIQNTNERILNIQKQLDEMELITDNSNLSAQQKKESLMNELYEVNTEKESNIVLLKKWVNVAQLFFSLDTKADTNIVKKSESSSPNPSTMPSSPEEVLKYNIETIQQAQNYVLVIGLYILPLFYGLLGAITFVLRDLSNKTQKMQYTKGNNISHILRLILGTIAGLAVGVFWGDLKQQENFIIIKSLGPLIVAYLSGLTVEYIFSAIEKWIGSMLDKALSKNSN